MTLQLCNDTHVPSLLSRLR